MEKSLRDTSSAIVAFQWLASCANKENVGDPFRALCAANAKRLALRYPDRFAQDYAAIESNASPRIKDFLEKVIR